MMKKIGGIIVTNSVLKIKRGKIKEAE